MDYQVWQYNNENRSTKVWLSHSSDDAGYTSIVATEVVTTETLDPAPTWTDISPTWSNTISGLSIADGAYYYLSWDTDDLGGSDSRDEFAIDNIQITGQECEVAGDCDDTLWCNGAESCNSGVCQAGTPPDLSDGVACTDDTCDEVADAALNTANDANCDNEVVCDGAEICDAVADCQPGINEDDGTPCGDLSDAECDRPDSCLGGVCVPNYEPNSTSCTDDGQFCTGSEFCSIGECLSLGNPCELTEACIEGDDICYAPETLVINEIDYDQPGEDWGEFVEIYNADDNSVNLKHYSLELIDGTDGHIYGSIELPDFLLEAAGYYVICGSLGVVAGCDLEVTPHSDLLQDGAPDAIALVLGEIVVDAVSYEGDVPGPYTEGSGVDLEDSGTDSCVGISRVVDGVDTDSNSEDFAARCFTPGESNSLLDRICSCGDGILDADEECDNGEDNSDTEPDACRSNCSEAYCGDLVVDQGEACDNGDDNSDTEPDACRTSCSEAYCGDLVVDQGETCDNGEDNSDTEPDACRNNCALASCGDGVVDDLEECDEGVDNSDTEADACRTTCVDAYCGDNVLDDGEECDDGADNDDNLQGGCSTTCIFNEESFNEALDGTPDRAPDMGQDVDRAETNGVETELTMPDPEEPGCACGTTPNRKAGVGFLLLFAMVLLIKRRNDWGIRV